MDREVGEQPLYDLATRSWTRTCPCIREEQRNPECPWHGRASMNDLNQAEYTLPTAGDVPIDREAN